MMHDSSRQGEMAVGKERSSGKERQRQGKERWRWARRDGGRQGEMAAGKERQQRARIVGAPSMREQHTDAWAAYPMLHGHVRMEGREERGERWRALAQDLDVVDPYTVARACAGV